MKELCDEAIEILRNLWAAFMLDEFSLAPAAPE